MGLYIHVPFCGSVCSYCHFVRTIDHDADLRRRYVAGVLKEWELRRDACGILAAGKRRLDTCYLGGGTPSCLEPELLSGLLEGTLGRMAVSESLELTAEANPETFTPAVARSWSAAGVNRVSLGIQSLDESVLRLLGRTCDPATARAALALACASFPRVSADWILGPGVRPDSLKLELSEAVDLGVEHFSLYILEVHPGTGLDRRLAAGEIALPDDAETESMYLQAADHLAALGVVQYEVANFARPGRESRHNQGYWSGKPWLGLGPGAHGYWGRQRYANHGDVQRWCDRVEAGCLPVASVDRLQPADIRLERIILALRTARGVRLSLLPAGSLDLARGQATGLWTIVEGRLALTTRGFLQIDTLEERLARALDP